ncbi:MULTISPECIES: RNA polymerase sigma factor [Bacteroides]|jgi:RNA polymerase sigma factor, sigma-70 family|uniref:Sigma-70 family RNA polymerase sigma factor n=1 Tax=Bacteroides nordii CL02T12C05 TaxID=997884 RepID=I8X2A4_9BACE|nr:MULTISPECIES: sigma-70 family RNA polymerase sigma factor [Bacteroides]EIY44985.1 sigma-70 family RNA polymerase sigma factor [Bacteroides nordii CL02T12C05]MBD9109763.1 sigma-70 family RNA polymerase sigma factor [Bacteroides nordii]MCE8465412.1 sigma-70 family RNA polymerase sigma factor [Bacteroides nordii]MCG4767681.1 sigma-70 family RNA polymerase sigma factor [Bacteroides nordii]OKZ07885.1 MAG: RNA polymerase subunit sigma-24 [Bacteroides sp. 41_26]
MNTWNNKADETLVSLYAEGENQAFNVLLNRYKDKLYSYIYYIVRNSEMTEDIFQETFMKAIITIRQGRYNENGKFSAWLRRIAHNLIIDSFRQEKSENLVSCDEPEVNILNNIGLAEGTIENAIVNRQILSDVRRLMEFLPDEQREVVYMRFYQDLSFKEIAEQTGVSINTSLGRMRYAILNLRRMAEKNGVVLTVD